MKTILNGKLYNTETAKAIGSYGNDYNGNDFRSEMETLYRKHTGEFFLAGEGGPMTKYRESVGDMWGYGHAIIPLSEDEAKEWVERHLTVDDYIDLVGEPEE